MTTALHEEMVAFFVETLRGPNEFDGLSPEAFAAKAQTYFPDARIRAARSRPAPELGSR